MGLRSRLKNKLMDLVGPAPAPTPAPAVPVARSSAPPTAPTPAAPATPAATAARPAVAKAPLSPEEEAKQAKIAAHQEKARKGVLKYLLDKGGSAEMADMHDYSERRYFIAHAGFRRMMEGYVADGLIDYSPTTGVATLTEHGRAYASA